MTWSSQIQAGFLVSRLTWGSHSAISEFRLRGYHALWPGFPACLTIPKRSYRGPATPQPLAWLRFGLFRFRSPLLPESSFLSLPPGTEMFHFPGFASTALWIQAGITGFSTRLGFPIRKPSDRSLVGGSPRLFAATRVLHRLLAPRHPSRALGSLQTSNF